MKLPDNYLHMEQGSSEWLRVRCGCVTSSRVSAVIKKLKNGKYSADRENYRYEKVAEILTDSVAQHYVSAEMMFGTENEPLARTAYELSWGVDVERIGYVKHAHIPQCGASPDGLVGDDGLIEIKVPNTTTHLHYMLSGEIPEEYLAQMMWAMCCTDRKWCDFVSYDPRLPQEYGLFVRRQQRDDKIMAAMEHEVELFLSEVNGIVEMLRKLGRPPIPELQGPPKAEIPNWEATV